jgi:hypothetical protein
MADFKNKRPKTGGRQKGTPNKLTSELKELIGAFTVGNWGQFVKAVNSLDPKEQAEVFIKLLKYVVPAQQKIELDGDLKTAAIEVTFNPTGITPTHDEAAFIDD